MKRFLFLMSVFISCSVLFAQPKTVEYQKENDFIVAVLNNPTFSIYEFLCSGLNEKNTQFLAEYQYRKSNFVKNKCKEMYGIYTDAIFHNIYRKVSASWTVFKEVQFTDLSYDGFGKYMMFGDEYSLSDVILGGKNLSGMFDTRRHLNCPNPELKHKLSIVPLKLE